MSYVLADFLDFNDAETQHSFEIIPKGTIAKVNMILKPGGYTDPDQGWTDGYSTKSNISDSVYLAAEFIILEGPYAKRKVWSLIGLYSPKGPDWANMGRSFIKAILNSSRGFAAKDESDAAKEARQIKSFAELDGVQFLALIDTQINKDTGELRNVINIAITKDHKDHVGGAKSTTTTPSWAR